MEFRICPQRPTVQPFAVLSGVVALSVAIVTEGVSEDHIHDAHMHGVSRLNVAIEENTVEMELLSPGANIVGFEHAAETAEDKALVARATALLHDGETLFAFPSGAKCLLQAAEVESALIEEDHSDHDEHETHESDEHTDEHADEHETHENDEHADEHNDEHSDDADHAEFHARYHFQCGQPEQLEHIDVKLFEHFPGTNELEVQTISPNGQGAYELTPASPRLNF